LGASPGSAGCFKKPTQIPNAGHPIYRFFNATAAFLELLPNVHQYFEN
jgi:hypothetical protein